MRKAIFCFEDGMGQFVKDAVRSIFPEDVVDKQVEEERKRRRDAIAKLTEERKERQAFLKRTDEEAKEIKKKEGGALNRQIKKIDKELKKLGEDDTQSDGHQPRWIRECRFGCQKHV